jgi:glycogen operon protein
VRAPLAEAVDLCLFQGEVERRVAMARAGETWTATVPGDLNGTLYGYRAHGEWAPGMNEKPQADCSSGPQNPNDIALAKAN